MGKSQRTKGAVYEREVASLFTTFFAPHSFSRNIGQARDGGNDIDVGPLVVECKRRSTLGTILGWYEQAKAAATERAARGRKRSSEQFVKDHVPIVVARADNSSEHLVIISLPDFLKVAGDFIQREL